MIPKTSTDWLVAWLALVLLAHPACGKSGDGPGPDPEPDPGPGVEARDVGATTEGASRTEGTASPENETRFARFPSLAQAVAHIAAERKPLVIGFGEFHQTADASPVLPTLERFAADIDTLAQGASDLIVETWIEAGHCGTTEEVVNRDVREVTERPPVVENQLLTLLSGAKERGVAPHVMTMECADYDRILVNQEVDFEKMLELIKHKLSGLATRVWQYREKERQENPEIPQRTILIYGGALHNDIHPTAGIEHFSYAADVRALVGESGYVEIDLLVPEYIEGNPLITQEPWYPSFLRHANPDSVLVYERAPGSYAVILRKDVVREQKPAPPP